MGDYRIWIREKNDSEVIRAGREESGILAIRHLSYIASGIVLSESGLSLVKYVY